MSWVSNANIKTIMQSIRNKFVTSELVVANDDKTVGAHINHTAQDGLVTISPISETEGTGALWVTDANAANKTELTGGTFSYVSGDGDNESGAYLSLVGETATFGKISGDDKKLQIGNVAEPTSDYQVANKKYVDSKSVFYHTANITYSASSLTLQSLAWLDADYSTKTNYLAADYTVVGTNCTPLSGYYTLLPFVLVGTSSDGYITLSYRIFNISSSAVNVSAGKVSTVSATIVKK